MHRTANLFIALCLLAAVPAGLSGCGGSPSQGGGEGHGGASGARTRPGNAAGRAGQDQESETAAVPVEIARAVRTGISSYIETNGTLEAENEVDIVARTAAPIVELLAEEGEAVRAGQVLARLDELEYRAELEIARVALNQAKLAFGRAETLKEENLVSSESYEQALSTLEEARAQVDAATGTIKVTLQVDPRDLLRPGMFARVFIETDTRDDALVIPKAALSLESIGDTVFVAIDGVAARREVVLGFEEGDFVEVASGVEEGEAVVVIGQDGLSDGTPIRILESAPAAR